MKPPALTPRFDGRLFKPVHHGVYRQMQNLTHGYRKWDGIAWGPWKESAEEAARCKPGEYAMGFYQSDDWQGVLEEPQALSSKEPQTEETILDRLADLEARVFRLENPQHGVKKEM